MITDTFAETSRPLTSGQPAEMVQAAVDRTKACVQDTLAHTGHYVRSHPVPVLLGALALGIAMGCALAAGRREETVREKLLDQKLNKFRDALYEALEPVSDHLKDDYTSVQNCVDKTFSNGGHGLAAQLGRFGRNLKFW